jgi:hypothetical protein
MLMLARRLHIPAWGLAVYAGILRAQLAPLPLPLLLLLLLLLLPLLRLSFVP